MAKYLKCTHFYYYYLDKNKYNKAHLCLDMTYLHMLHTCRSLTIEPLFCLNT